MSPISWGTTVSEHSSLLVGPILGTYTNVTTYLLGLGAASPHPSTSLSSVESVDRFAFLYLVRC